MGKQRLGLLGLWFAVTAANLFKPYHIDDTAHLVIAQWIAGHPLHPMRGLLNWGGTAQPIYDTNQPHLYFYVLAGWGRMFGWSAPAMHGVQALFAGACILLFFRLARRLKLADPLWLTAMLVLGPAFLVEQNLMVDVPLLSVFLWFFDTLLARRFAQAAVACSAAVLIKYSALVLLPVLAAGVLLAWRPRALWVLLIPALVLAAWSGFNLFDYGGVHLTTALHASAQSYVPPTYHKHFRLLRRLVKSVIAWTVAVGALTPFGVMAALRGRRWAVLGYTALLAGFFALAAAVWAGWLSDMWADRLLWLGFATSGALVAVYGGLNAWRQRRPEVALLVLWVAATSAFYILCAPFIAARHVLLILPAISLLVALAYQGGFPLPAKLFGLALTVALSSGLAVSDFRFAAFYKMQATAIPATLPAGATIWAAGHWGWQYYTTQAGITALDIKKSHIMPGDFVLVPEEVDHQLPAGLPLSLVRTVTGNVSTNDPLCTARPSRFYLSYTFRGPWSLSANCMQHIDIYRVN